MKNNIKIAFLIMAYNNIELLNIFIKQLLQYEESYVFIHIDKKSTIENSMIYSNKRIIIFDERIEMNWGDYSQVECMELLIRKAYSYGNFDYFSLHSGQDLAITPIINFVEMLSKNSYDAYLEVEQLPIKGFSHAGGVERLGLYYPKFMRKRYSRKNIIRYLRAGYMCLYKFYPFKITEKDNYWFGSQWFTASKKAINYLINYLDENPNYYKRFKHGLCTDEIFINTIFMRNEELKIAKRDNLRYICWDTYGLGAGSPKTLTSDDYLKICSSGKYFARKFDYATDKDIINKFINN